jgi:hypothetical protein
MCNETHDEKSGKFFKHIRNKHNLSSKSEYYYMTHDSDLCDVCKVENKEVRTWSFEKYDTCKNEECKTINSNTKKRNGQINLYKNGDGNFQKPDVRKKSKIVLKQQYLDGTAYCLRDDAREKLSARTTLRNLTNNPMKNKDSALKVSVAKTGVPQSALHRANISIGLSNYLSNLSDEEFATRMLNTQRISDRPICEDILNKNKKEKLDNWLENIEQHRCETENILMVMRDWAENHLGLLNLILEQTKNHTDARNRHK